MTGKYAFVFAALLCSVSGAMAQVRFFSDFEAGAIGRVEVTDSITLSYDVYGRFDPVNPIDSTLEPSANWFFFGMTGVEGKCVSLTMKENGIPCCSYSYDSAEWHHFSLDESDGGRIEKCFERDSVFIALYAPYTYSYFRERMEWWCERSCVSNDTVGWSAEGRPMEVLHISEAGTSLEGKRRVWIHCRQHPSETPASWMLDGMLEFLTGDDVTACSLRQQIDFYVMPMANPDGVADGLSRSNAIGVNHEINFARSADSTVVEVTAVKDELARLMEEGPMDVCLNFHSQLAPYATFWIHKPESCSQRFFMKQMLLCGLVCDFNPYIDRSDLSYSNLASRYVEGWIWNRVGEKTMALTAEVPYSFYSHNPEGYQVDNENLAFYGRRLLDAMAEYLGISTPGRIVVMPETERARGWRNGSDDSLPHFGEMMSLACRKGARMKYRLNHLDAGNYELFRYDSVKGGWCPYVSVSQRKSTSFKYTFKAEKAGNVADAILLLRK